MKGGTEYQSSKHKRMIRPQTSITITVGGTLLDSSGRSVESTKESLRAILQKMNTSSTKVFRVSPALILLCIFALEPAAFGGFVDDWARMKTIVPQGYVCVRAAEPIKIDGVVSEADWVKAPWTRDFRDIEGDARPIPRFRTRAKMLWDNDYFYVAVEVEEPHVWGTITNHDAVIFQDNDFEVFIDPNADNHEYYEFEMNALNTGWDLLLKKPYIDGGPALNEWEIPGLKTAVHVNGTINNPADRDVGWSIEIAFPWKALAQYAHRPAPPHEGDQWRVNFSRVEWQIRIIEGRYEKVPGAREDNWVWSPQGIIDMHRPEQWGYVQFTEKHPAQETFTPDPSAKARQVLRGIYYAQKDFEKAHHRWAGSMNELGLTGDFDGEFLVPPALRLTPEGFECSATIRLPKARLLKCSIRQDGRIVVSD